MKERKMKLAAKDTHYIQLSKEMQERIADDRASHRVNPYAFRDEDVIRKYMDHDKSNVWRPAFVRDVEKILHNPYYLRYSDKTQVFSFVNNDDISRRAYHVQLVARIARNIGRALGLNEDLIEAIALGHDIGHTPFGHAGERLLNDLYHGNTGRNFNHNIQSARVFNCIFPVNVSMQTLDGIICHNGELELKEYKPLPYDNFSDFEKKMEETYVDQTAVERLIPATLEGCVMRVSDIIAYIGKDRQDAERLEFLAKGDVEFSGGKIGSNNSEIINNMIVNIVENSYGKPYLSMDDDYFQAFRAAKKENSNIIYKQDSINSIFDETIKPMMEEMYKKLLADLKEGNKNSIIYSHHMDYVKKYNDFETGYYPGRVHYEEESPDAIVTDYIASMTDDYFLDAYDYIFPERKINIKYRGYFD